MPESVGSGPDIDIRFLAVGGDEELDGPDRERPVMAILKERRPRCRGEPPRTIELQELFDTGPGGTVQRDNPTPRAFAEGCREV